MSFLKRGRKFVDFSIDKSDKDNENDENDSEMNQMANNSSNVSSSNNSTLVENSTAIDNSTTKSTNSSSRIDSFPITNRIENNTLTIPMIVLISISSTICVIAMVVFIIMKRKQKGTLGMKKQNLLYKNPVIPLINT